MDDRREDDADAGRTAFDNSGSYADSPPLLVAEELRVTLQLHEPDAIPEMTTAIRPLLSDPA